MRIIGSIDHPTLKITVFKMNNRLSVKFETELTEQTYKFRISDRLENMEDVRRMVDEAFLRKVEAGFVRMIRHRNDMLARLDEAGTEEEFEEII